VCVCVYVCGVGKKRYRIIICLIPNIPVCNNPSRLLYVEFVIMMQTIHNIKCSFNQLDTNHNGVLEKNELKVLVNEVGQHLYPSTVDKIMAQSDKVCVCVCAVCVCVCVCVSVCV